MVDRHKTCFAIVLNTFSPHPGGKVKSAAKYRKLNVSVCPTGNVHAMDLIVADAIAGDREETTQQKNLSFRCSTHVQ